MSPQHLFLPLICVTSAIFNPYTPTQLLYLTPIYFIYLSIYLYPLTHFLSPLYFTHSLSLYISSQHFSLLASCSPSHSILFKSPLYHHFTLYLSHTLYLTLSDFYRASASPISIMPHNKLDHGYDILPPAPLLLLSKLG